MVPARNRPGTLSSAQQVLEKRKIQAAEKLTTRPQLNMSSRSSNQRRSQVRLAFALVGTFGAASKLAATNIEIGVRIAITADPLLYYRFRA